jgi:hypothetical protein
MGRGDHGHPPANASGSCFGAVLVGQFTHGIRIGLVATGCFKPRCCSCKRSEDYLPIAAGSDRSSYSYNTGIIRLSRLRL